MHAKRALAESPIKLKKRPADMHAMLSNSDLACRWHPGIKKVDAAWNSVWSCCGQRHAMKGCSVGRHIASLDDDAESDDESGL